MKTETSEYQHYYSDSAASQYQLLNESLDGITNHDKAREVGLRMRALLLQMAQGSHASRGDTIYDRMARDLASTMFNRFRLTEFDNLVNELQAVLQNPIGPMFPPPEEQR